MRYVVVVLGAGSAVQLAAIRPAQLGLSVAIDEANYWGGVCLNVGCIRSKALLRNAEIAHLLRVDADTFGIEAATTMRTTLRSVIGRARGAYTSMTVPFRGCHSNRIE
jgi:dihydrolipoamide dehydrogenase